MMVSIYLLSVKRKIKKPVTRETINSATIELGGGGGGGAFC